MSIIACFFLPDDASDTHFGWLPTLLSRQFIFLLTHNRCAKINALVLYKTNYLHGLYGVSLTLLVFYWLNSWPQYFRVTKKVPVTVLVTTLSKNLFFYSTSSSEEREAGQESYNAHREHEWTVGCSQRLRRSATESHGNLRISWLQNLMSRTSSFDSHWTKGRLVMSSK